jgi:hypothetical protein
VYPAEQAHHCGIGAPLAAAAMSCDIAKCVEEAHEAPAVTRDNFHIVLALHFLAGSLLGLWLAPSDLSSLDTCESAAGVCGHQQRVVGFLLYSTCQQKQSGVDVFCGVGGTRGCGAVGCSSIHPNNEPQLHCLKAPKHMGSALLYRQHTPAAVLLLVQW